MLTPSLRECVNGYELHLEHNSEIVGCLHMQMFYVLHFLIIGGIFSLFQGCNFQPETICLDMPLNLACALKLQEK